MNDTPIVSQEVTKQQFQKAMRLFVGQGKRWSVMSVVAATGICKRTIDAYRAGETPPSLSNYHTLCSVLGQGFFNVTIEHLPFEARSTEAGEATPQQVLSGVLGYSADLAVMLEDGRIDHRELEQLKQATSELLTRLTQLENGLRGG